MISRTFRPSMSLFLTIVVFLTWTVSCKKKEDATPSNLIVKVLYNGEPMNSVHVFTVPSTLDQVTDAYGLTKFEGIPAAEYQVYAESGVMTGKSIVILGEGDNQTVNIDINFTGPISFIPVINFLLPDINHAYAPGDTVVFRVKVSNYKPGSQVVWSSDLDGLLASTPIDASGFSDFSTHTLSAGEHVISVKSTGNQGYSAVKVQHISMNGPKKVFLYPLEIQGDQVVLKWSKLQGDDFDFYQVNCRVSNKPGDPFSSTYTYGHILVQGDTTLSVALPTNYYIAQYYIMAGNRSGNYNVSNFRELSHNLGPLFNGVPVQMMLHPQLSRVYLIFSGETILYDYEKQEVVATAETGSSLKFNDLGDNGAGLELYLADKATVHVLDGTTLALKKTIPFANDIISVVSSGLGFLICAQTPTTPDVKPLQFYSLGQQAVISEGGEPNDAYYMRKVPGHNILAACTRRGYSAELDYFEYNNAGTVTLHKDIFNASGGYSLEIMKMSPNGNYFCVGSGANFRQTNETLTHVAALENSGSTSDYTFNDTGEIAYTCSGSYSSYVREYHYPSGSNVRSYPVYGRPQQLAFRNNTLILATETVSGSEFCIELLPLGNNR